MSAIYFYALFKTTAPDGSAFFGITRTQNPSYGQDGQPMSYMGNGPKLQQKARQYGLGNLTIEVLSIDADYNVTKQRLDRILTPATLADPRCLNMPRIETNAKISEALIDKPKSEDHKLAIAESMVGNDNATGHVVSEQAKEAISEANAGGTGKMKWWHRPDTGEEVQLPADEEGLTSFVIGRLPKELAKNFKRDRKKVMSDAERAMMSKD